uniref:Ribosomal protein S10 n=1 Tax=Panagrolaimus superbus TaxID=310955 RepID=A0A914XPS2_9BILA
MEHFRLLRRPRPLPNLDETKPGINAEYKIKFVYFKSHNDLVPRICYKAKASVQHANLVITSSLPPVKISIPLVTICYLESDKKYDRFDIRGRQFKLRFVGFRDIMQPMATLEESRDWLRFLVVRQRIPHSILQLPFEWEMQIERRPKRMFISWKKIKKNLFCHKCIQNPSKIE